MNEQLANLYRLKWAEYNSALKTLETTHNIPKPTMPLLLGVENESEYQHSDLRIMVLGQETNSWHQYCPEIPIQKLQNWNIDRTLRIQGKAPFANAQRKMRRYFTKYFPDLKCSYLWNNVVKIGLEKGKGFPGDQLYQIEKRHFNILKEEIAILNPNVLIFLSGPYYDQYIFDKLGKLEKCSIPNFELNQLCELKVQNTTCAIRTYHPNYLYRNGIDKFYHAMTERIKLNLAAR
ncbi:MAG: hypothetical protein IAE95_01235 [Chitinophagaceae bacterium]|nr:hypothetical protein [Chitinophagaceae bacterium]